MVITFFSNVTFAATPKVIINKPINEFVSFEMYLSRNNEIVNAVAEVSVTISDVTIANPDVTVSYPDPTGRSQTVILKKVGTSNLYQGNLELFASQIGFRFPKLFEDVNSYKGTTKFFGYKDKLKVQVINPQNKQVITSAEKNVYFTQVNQVANNMFASTWKVEDVATVRYNCMAYAIGVTNSWQWDWQGNMPTLAEVTFAMQKRNFVQTKDLKSATVIVYGKNNLVTHFAKNINGGTGSIAKWGTNELMSSNSINPYPANGIYGIPIAFYKPIK